MNLSDFKKKQLAIASYFEQEYPIRGSKEIEGSLEDSIKSDEKLYAKYKKYYIKAKEKKGDGTILTSEGLTATENMAVAIDRAIYFEKMYTPEGWSPKNYIVQNPKKIDLFGNKVSLPGCVTLDYGIVECKACNNRHAKIVVVYCARVLYIDYIVEENEIQDVSETIFWEKPIHDDDYENPENPFEEDYEEEESEDEDWAVVGPESRARLILGPNLFAGKAWSYSSRITENDSIENKIDRVSDTLQPLKDKVCGIIKEVPENWEIEAFHFSSGWKGESYDIPPFFIFYVGAVENNSHCNCIENHMKYVTVYENETMFIDFCETNKVMLELEEGNFWQGEIIKGHKGCH
jgi:hypothetical protein